MMVTYIMTICALVVLGATALAQSNNTTTSATPGGKLCSNRTLNGDYGILLEGTILGANIPFRGVVMQDYDGNGNITQVDHVVFGGTPPPLEWTPVYRLLHRESDCTGVALLQTETGDHNLHFVEADNGKLIKQVVDANAVTAIGNKVN